MPENEGRQDAPEGEERGIERNEGEREIDRSEETDTSISPLDEGATEETPAPEEAPAEETPTEEEPVEETSEMTEEERTDWVTSMLARTEERERNLIEEKYGRGWLGKARHWLNETDAGKAVKIGGKVVLGASAGLIAGTLSGGAGLILAPALYTLGLKTYIDGGIEAVQYLGWGRGRRLALEGAKMDYRKGIEESVRDMQSKRDSGEMTEEEFLDQLSGVVTEMADAEEAIVRQENDNITWERKQGMYRGIASSVAAVGVGLLAGIPLGVQNFDKDGVSHSVRYTFRGFEYIYNNSSEVANAITYARAGGLPLTITNSIMGVPGHALGSFGSAAAAAKAYVGIGTAFTGLCAQTVYEIAQGKKKGEFTTDNPRELIELVEEEKKRRSPTPEGSLSDSTASESREGGEETTPPGTEEEAEAASVEKPKEGEEPTEEIEKEGEPEEELTAEELSRFLEGITGRESYTETGEIDDRLSELLKIQIRIDDSVAIEAADKEEAKKKIQKELKRLRGMREKL